MLYPSAAAVAAADLATCDHEPIHLPGAIEPHGILLVLAEPGLEILQASASLRSLLGLDAAGLLGQSLTLLLDTPSHECLRHSLRLPLDEPHYLPALITSTGQRFEAVIHRSAAGIILELEPHAGPGTLDVARILRDAMAEAHRAPSLVALCQAAAQRLRGMTGFDRVMVYRFLPDGAGTVIAEARCDELPPYLGLAFPATDIPAPARQVLLVTPLRVRKGDEAPASPLLPAISPVTGEKLDMSRCALRATAPVHLEYLRNMGVRASLTLSIVLDGGLWGMFAAHHGEARYVPHAQRLACQALGHLLALQIEAKQQAEEAADRIRMQRFVLRSLRAAVGAASLAEALQRLGPSLLGVVGAEGVAIRSASGTVTFGTTPDAQDIPALLAWLAQQLPEGVFATDALGRAFAPGAAYADRGSGVLALRLSADAAAWVVWFRREWVRTVSWAGDPRRPPPDGERISPRKSFAAWSQTVRGQSQPWTPAEIGAVQALRAALLDAIVAQGGTAAD